MIHLDTSFLVDLLREQHRATPGPATRWLEGEAHTDLAAALFVRCELEAGAARSANPARERARIREVLASVAHPVLGDSFSRTYGVTLDRVLTSGKSISTMDLLIATAALDDDAALVTSNPRHFAVVPGLRIVSYR